MGWMTLIGYGWKALRWAMRLFGLAPGGLAGSPKMVALAVAVVAVLVSGGIYAYMSWTISDLQTQIAKREKANLICNNNLDALQQSLSKQNKKIEELQDKSIDSNEQAKDKAKKIMDNNNKTESTGKPGDINKWLRERF